MKETDRDRLLIERSFQEAGIEWQGGLYPLSQDKKTLKKAAPVLMRLFDQVSSPITKGNIAQVVSSAKVPPAPFLKMLQALRPAIEAGDESAVHLGWTLGDALREIGDPSVFEDILEIVEDRRYGIARQMLVMALERFPTRQEESIPTLLRIVDDEQVILHTLHALGRLRAIEAIGPIQRHLVSSKPHIRKEAKQALARIDPELAKASSPPKPKRKRLCPIPADYEEASANFDLHGVAPFLERLTTLVDGFGSAERETVEQLLDAMEVEEEAELEFPVVFGDKKVRLRFKLFMCDEGAVDLFVFTVQPLSDQIQDAMSDENE